MDTRTHSEKPLDLDAFDRSERSSVAVSPRGAGHRRSLNLVSGLGVFLVLVITLAWVMIDVTNENRQAQDQLDIAGQSLVETIHEYLNTVESVLLGAKPEGPLLSDPLHHLEAVLALDPVSDVGHAADPRSPIAWSTGLGAVNASPALMADATGTGPIVLTRSGNDLIIGHPYSSDGDSPWDFALIDMDLLADHLVPSALRAGVVWSLSPVQPGVALDPAESPLHREYLILDQSNAWVFELRWTENALSAQGVGVDWGGVEVGVLVALAVGLVVRRWMQGHYLEADVEAARSLVEQKDLLLLAISHQLRTPLTGVLGFIRLAVEGDPSPLSEEQRTELLGLALDQAEVAAEIVEDLILATRIEDDNFVLITRQFDVAPLIDGVLGASMLPREDYRVDADSKVPQVLADPLRTRQLVRNILGKGRQDGARRWDVTIRGDGAMVKIRFALDVELQPDATALTRKEVASPKSLEALRPRLAIAETLATMMGGDLSIESGRERTDIVVTLPTLPDDPPSEPLVVGDLSHSGRRR